MMALIVLLALASLVLLFGVVFYNQLVRLKNMVAEGWSGIDVQLKKRANLIPNLVEAVKGYMGHERELLEKVTALRSKSMRTTDPAAKAEHLDLGVCHARIQGVQRLARAGIKI